MELLIVPEWFAPKIPGIPGKIHCVYTPACNFRCSFCSQSHRAEYVKTTTYDMATFRDEVARLVPRSPYFKLTGGEPTVLPEIMAVMETIRDGGGFVFLDTNASRTDLVGQAVDAGLVHVLGVSIKGLTKQEAVRKSGVKNEALCWDNVLESCRRAHGKATTILTYVVDDSTDEADVLAFCRRIADGEILVDHFKLNNLYGKELPDPSLRPMESRRLLALGQAIVDTCPALKDRLIVIPGFDAVTNSEAIVHF